MEEELILEAKLLHTIFYNEANGYAVGKFITYDANEEDFIATGFFRELQEEVIYRLHGSYVDHPRYGMQFQVKAYEKVMPQDDESLIRFFASSLFPGIGKQSAKLLVETLGPNVIERIKEDEQVLLQIPSFTPKKRQVILDGIHEHDDVDDTTFFFTRVGISVRNIMKFEAKYGQEAVALIKENPYRLIEEIDGIGFKTADKLAQELSFGLDHPYRIKAAILSMILEMCMASGDTFVTTEDLTKRVEKEFKDVDLPSYLDELAKEFLIHREEERIYHHTQYDSETGIAAFLAMFPFEEQEPTLKEELMQDMEELEQTLHIQYEERQKESILTFFAHSFSILTGGPGTGKTTIVQGVLTLYKQHYPNDVIAVCAPTGRAAKRLSELCGCNATTIHSLLRWDLESNTFLVNEKEPLQCDLLIIDEFSMVDQWLFYNLLKASKLVKKILIIGDEDQLPSVGCGSVLKDLIACEQFAVTRLHKIFRQSEGSDVIALAHEIREEHITVLDHAKDIAFFDAQNYEVRDLVVRIVANALEKGYEPKDIQVLAPKYGGVAGIDALNNALQKMMNPSTAHKRELKVGYRIFRVGDKVLQLKNQPEDEVYNGDIGEIVDIAYASESVGQKHKLLVDFDGIMVEYSNEQLYNITHAFCISIHKAQGSEYPIVILPIVSEYAYMMSKRLLYTAFTRAKKSLVLLGERDMLHKAVTRKERHQRNSTLEMRIRKLFHA